MGYEKITSIWSYKLNNINYNKQQNEIENISAKYKIMTNNFIGNTK